jgi:alpha-ketoglutarate-dependent taurine dioxygenase
MMDEGHAFASQAYTASTLSDPELGLAKPSALKSAALRAALDQDGYVVLREVASERRPTIANAAEQDGVRTLLMLSRLLKLGYPIVPRLYRLLADHGIRTDLASPFAMLSCKRVPFGTFERDAAESFHRDGTLDSPFRLRYTLVLCLARPAQGGETLVFQSARAVERLGHEDARAARALAEALVLRRADLPEIPKSLRAQAVWSVDCAIRRREPPDLRKPHESGDRPLLVHRRPAALESAWAGSMTRRLEALFRTACHAAWTSWCWTMLVCRTPLSVPQQRAEPPEVVALWLETRVSPNGSERPEWLRLQV